MSRKTTDEEIRKAIAYVQEMMREQNGGEPVCGKGHIDFTDCAVWFDEDGYTVVDRDGKNRSAERVAFRCEGCACG